MQALLEGPETPPNEKQPIGSGDEVVTRVKHSRRKARLRNPAACGPSPQPNPSNSAASGSHSSPSEAPPSVRARHAKQAPCADPAAAAQARLQQSNSRKARAASERAQLYYKLRDAAAKTAGHDSEGRQLQAPQQQQQTRSIHAPHPSDEFLLLVREQAERRHHQHKRQRQAQAQLQQQQPEHASSGQWRQGSMCSMLMEGDREDDEEQEEQEEEEEEEEVAGWGTAECDLLGLASWAGISTTPPLPPPAPAAPASQGELAGSGMLSQQQAQPPRATSSAAAAAALEGLFPALASLAGAVPSDAATSVVPLTPSPAVTSAAAPAPSTSESPTRGPASGQAEPEGIAGWRNGGLPQAQQQQPQQRKKLAVRSGKGSRGSSSRKSLLKAALADSNKNHDTDAHSPGTGTGLLEDVVKRGIRRGGASSKVATPRKAPPASAAAAAAALAQRPAAGAGVTAAAAVGATYSLPALPGGILGSSPVSTLKYLTAAQNVLHEVCHCPSSSGTQCRTRRAAAAAAASPAAARAGLHVASLPRGGVREQAQQLRALLTDVERRYKEYKGQLQPLVECFSCAAGTGVPHAAAAYTEPTLQAISLAFRRIREAVVAHLHLIAA
eukprot:jgi/Mesen1/5304/ME000264S04330